MSRGAGARAGAAGDGGGGRRRAGAELRLESYRSAALVLLRRDADCRRRGRGGRGAKLRGGRGGGARRRAEEGGWLRGRPRVTCTTIARASRTRARAPLGALASDPAASALAQQLDLDLGLLQERWAADLSANAGCRDDLSTCPACAPGPSTRAPTARRSCRTPRRSGRPAVVEAAVEAGATRRAVCPAGPRRVDLERAGGARTAPHRFPRRRRWGLEQTPASQREAPADPGGQRLNARYRANKKGTESRAARASEGTGFRAKAGFPLCLPRRRRVHGWHVVARAEQRAMDDDCPSRGPRFPLGAVHNVYFTEARRPRPPISAWEAEHAPPCSVARLAQRSWGWQPAGRGDPRRRPRRRGPAATSASSTSTPVRGPASRAAAPRRVPLVVHRQLVHRLLRLVLHPAAALYAYTDGPGSRGSAWCARGLALVPGTNGAVLEPAARPAADARK